MTTQLDNETNLIHHAGIRALVRLTLEAAPACFWTMPAATSGKYHPASSLGTGGLIRHTKSVLRIAQHLLHMDGIAPQSIHYDLVLAACILHDCCKKSDAEQYTAFDHPLRAAELILTTAAPLIAEDLITRHAAHFICTAVAAHMGRWNTNPHHPTIILPTPLTPLQRLVHTADYLASRKDIALL